MNLLGRDPPVCFKKFPDFYFVQVGTLVTISQDIVIFYFYKVVFEGVKGTSYTGDIAIDDIKIMNGSCPTPGDCSFDNGMCTWTNSRTGDNFDWIIGGGRTPSFLTGPSKDHTTGSGRLRIAFLSNTVKLCYRDVPCAISTLQSFDEFLEYSWHLFNNFGFGV